MDYFEYKSGILHAEDVNLNDIANQYGTPCYVYSRATFERHWNKLNDIFKQAKRPHLVCYAVKANSNLAVLNILATLGSGFDIVSGGELERVLRAGGQADKVVFSGVGKTIAEMQQALTAGIRCFNIESSAELIRLNQVAGEMGKIAPISIRVNPDVDAKTHPYISTGLKENKFGIDTETAFQVYQHATQLPHVKITGIDCHIGSQLTEITPFVDALKRILALIEKLKTINIEIHHIDVGGGLGIRYDDETPPEPEVYAKALTEVLADTPYEILLEPGRIIAANAGILLTMVEYLKPTADKNFAIIDAAMNDLIRPSLYSAWHTILPVQPRNDIPEKMYDLVGPICDTGDFLGKNRSLAIQAGDVLAVRSAGAYGFSMSSNYNSRPRAIELMVDKDKVHVVRKRETVDDLLHLEHII